MIFDYPKVEKLKIEVQIKFDLRFFTKINFIYICHVQFVKLFILQIVQNFCTFYKLVKVKFI
jgi:hypothetical protein